MVPAAGAPLYANPKSDHARRGAFATKNLWVTPFAEDEFYPAGNYPLEPNPQGIKDWTNKVRRPAHISGLLCLFSELASGKLHPGQRQLKAQTV